MGILLHAFPIGVVKNSPFINNLTIKDYYQTLEIASSATPEEIKKSFRRLAHEYHPDKNTTNAFAEARFREILEAYTVLSNESKRAGYDQERWLSGRFKKNAAALTPEYFLQEIRKLNQHLASVDIYRMNKELLHNYLLFMLSDDKSALLIQKATPETIDSITQEIIKAMAHLPPYFSLPVLHKLTPVAHLNEDALHAVTRKTIRIKKEEKKQKLYPWLVVLITLLILLAMYLFSKK